MYVASFFTKIFVCIRASCKCKSIQFKKNKNKLNNADMEVISYFRVCI